MEPPTKLALALFSALVLCTACAELTTLPGPQTPPPLPPPSPTPSPTPEPRSLTICLSEEPDSLYLYGTDSSAAHHVWQAVYDGPIDNRNYTHQPVLLTELPSLERGTARVETVTVSAGERVLAAGGSVMELAPGVIVENTEGERVAFHGAPIPMDRMVVTFTLRSDLRWSDSEPLTADDSVYSFQLAADPATPADKVVIERTADYHAIDGQRVVWQGVPGFLDPAYALNFWHPLPRHSWNGLSAADLLSSEVATREPLGWGPFVIREWMADDRLRLERNPFYFRASEGLPRLDEVTFRFIDNPDELAEELIGGGCDVMPHETADAALATRGEAAVPATMDSLVTQDAAWEMLVLGISPAPGYDRPDFFEDVRVRRGIAQCIDRQAVANAASTAGGSVPHSTLPPEHPLYAGEKLKVWEYDPQAGQLLLAQAGWYDEDGDGVREAHGVPSIADGTPFQVMYHTTDDPLRLRTAELVQAQLRTCGIQTSLQTLPSDELFAPGPNGVLFGRHFDLAQFSWRATAIPVCDLFLSSQIPGDGDWSRPNVAGFIDGGYDAACQAALEALPGTANYAVAHTEAQRIFSEQIPGLPLFRHQRVTLVHASVTGLTPTPSQRSELWNLEQVDVRP
jgi:peptide/nickel transport system substrate-binding protein